MPPAVLCVPQWQGSGRSDARRLAEGARKTASLAPRARRADALVSDEAGEERDGVAHLDVLVGNLAAIRAAHAALPADGVLVAGGDCGVELAPVAAARERHGDALTVLWLDAHGDLNTPASSPSGAFHGMVLRALLGDGPAELVPRDPLRAAQVVLAGLRSLDPAERAFVESEGIRRVAPAEIGRIAELPAPLYVHVDLDVLDGSEGRANGYSGGRGLSRAALLDAIRMAGRRCRVAAGAITAYDPGYDLDGAVAQTAIEAAIALSTAATGSA